MVNMESSTENTVEFKSWLYYDEVEIKTDFTPFLSYELYVMLNLLGKTYHSAFGYEQDEHYIKNDAISPLSLEHDMLSHEEYSDEEDTTFVFINLKLAKKKAETTTFRHKTIILRIDVVENGSNWLEKPHKTTSTWFRQDECNPDPSPKYWYEFPESTFKSKANSKIHPLVGPLSSRSYIHVTEEFEEIEIRSEEKGSPITIDDVLFASRGLCKNDTQSIDGGYNVISDNGSVLILKVNWT